MIHILSANEKVISHVTNTVCNIEARLLCSALVSTQFSLGAESFLWNADNIVYVLWSSNALLLCCRTLIGG